MGKNSNDPPSVLIAEDDLIYQRLLEKYIEQAGGRCEFASDGKDAFEKATENEYDLIFIDIHIPSLDGIMLVKLLREDGCTTPLIAVTALQLECLERNALTVGFNEFFQKPISKAEILSLFEKYCRS
ncbi:MAG: response regulator [Desulfuromonadales bacterium]|jgi:CheY-like chemotaxis protein|nr:response regulator [Desulfuromonadales bacterium]